MSASAPSRTLPDWLLVGAALAASLALLWFVTEQPLVVAGFAGGLVAIGALMRVLTARRPPPAEPSLALPDWSVTVAAIEMPDSAIAVTDRVGNVLGVYVIDPTAPPPVSSIVLFVRL